MRSVTSILSLLCCLCVFVFVATAESVSYYELLQVEPSASASNIRQGYRKLALLNHPDKAAKSEKEAKQAIFVKLANAYEVLSDPVTRARYDWLLSHGVLEYEHTRNWSQWDIDHGLKEGQKSPRRFRDAYDQFKAAEDEETFALLLSFGISATVAVIPAFMAWRHRVARRAARAGTVPKSQLREAQQDLEERRKVEAQEADRRKQVAREQREERARRLAEPDEEEEDADADDADDAQAATHILQAHVGEADVKESASDVAVADESDSDEDGRASSAGIEFNCGPCRKAFKSLKQLENHEKSSKHKAAAKKATRPRDR